MPELMLLELELEGYRNCHNYLSSRIIAVVHDYYTINSSSNNFKIMGGQLEIKGSVGILD